MGRALLQFLQCFALQLLFAPLLTPRAEIEVDKRLVLVALIFVLLSWAQDLFENLVSKAFTPGLGEVLLLLLSP